jgi:hypothetical protein
MGSIIFCCIINNSIQFFIIYVPSQQPQGQLQAQHRHVNFEGISGLYRVWVKLFPLLPSKDLENEIAEDND